MCLKMQVVLVRAELCDLVPIPILSLVPSTQTRIHSSRSNMHPSYCRSAQLCSPIPQSLLTSSNLFQSFDQQIQAWVRAW